MNWLDHLQDVTIGAAAVSIAAHAVNTFPTPVNKYGAWLLGVIQYAVGQRVVAKNTFQGMDTAAQGVIKQG